MPWKVRRFEGRRLFESAGKGPAHFLFFLFHGFGTSAEDLVPLAEALRTPGVRFFLPDGFYDVPGMPGAHAWYDIQTHEEKSFFAARDFLHRLFQRIQEEQSAPIIASGFSQGAVMTLAAGLTFSGEVAGLAALSGYLPHAGRILQEAKAPKSIPLLLVHGTLDAVIPVKAARQAHEALEQAGYRPRFLEFPMAHEIAPAAFGALHAFFADILKNL